MSKQGKLKNQQSQMILQFLRQFAELERKNATESEWIELKIGCSPEKAAKLIADAREYERQATQ